MGRVEGSAGHGIETLGGLGRVADAQDEAAVFVVADSCVNAGATALQPIRIDSRVLERLPARLQHHALLRVEELRLHRRDSEERSVELVDVGDEGAEAASVVLNIGVRKQFAHAAGAGARSPFGHRVPAGFQQLPEGRDAVGAGEPAGHADDGNRLLFHETAAVATVGIAGRALPRTSGSCVHRRFRVCIWVFRDVQWKALSPDVCRAFDARIRHESSYFMVRIAYQYRILGRPIRECDEGAVVCPRIRRFGPRGLRCTIPGRHGRCSGRGRRIRGCELRPSHRVTARRR